MLSIDTVRVNAFNLTTAIAKVVDLMDPAIGRHHMQVAYWSHTIANTLAFPENEKFDLYLAGLLHDIGAFSLEGRLDLLNFEDEQPGLHAVAGSLILEKFSPFATIAELIRHHHLPWNHGAGRIVDGRTVLRGSHIIHLADRLAVSINRHDPVLAQVEDVMASIAQRSGDIFNPVHVEALQSLKHKEYIWLDATSDEIETVLKRAVLYPMQEFTSPQLVEFSKLICRLIDFKSEFTATHSSGVAAVAAALAKLSGFSTSECHLVEIAGYLHDLGKLAIPSEIIEKKGKLDQKERFIMRCHVYHTYQALAPFEVLGLVSQWGSLHQERLNGTGYPFGLEADDLPLGARIMAVADVFTALTENRPYRKGMTADEARTVMQSMADGGELDAGIIGRVFDHYDALNQIRSTAQQQAGNEYEDFRRSLRQYEEKNTG